MIPVKLPPNVKIIKEHHFDFGSIWVRSDGIVQIHAAEDTLFTIKETKLVHEKVNELTGEKPMLVLHLPGKHANADDETRKFLASEQASHNRIALAFVLQSMGQKIVGNFFLKINKPKVPTRFFNTQEEAETWLLQMKTKTRLAI
jgi:hypothetical protein